MAGIRNLHFKIRVISTVLFGNKKKYVVHYLVEFEANIFSAEHIWHMENINCHRILVGTAEISYNFLKLGIYGKTIKKRHLKKKVSYWTVAANGGYALDFSKSFRGTGPLICVKVENEF